MDTNKLEELINMLTDERKELEAKKEEINNNEFEQGLAFFMEVWNLMVDYKKYFNKLGEEVKIRYKHTEIRTQKDTTWAYSLEMEKGYEWTFKYNISSECGDVEALIRKGYAQNPQMILFFLNELMEQPFEYYQNQVNKRLADIIQKYNEKNNQLKKSLE